MPSRPSEKIEASPAALLVQSRTPQKSFLFLLEEKIGHAPNQKMRRKLFCWVASVSERRRGGASVSLKEISRKV